MSKWKSNRTICMTLSFMLAAGTVCSQTFPVFAVSATDNFSEEQWAALSDNNLDYAEIADLITAYNPAYTGGADNYYATVTQYEQAAASLKKEAKDMTDYADELGDMKDAGDIADGAVYSANAAALKSTAKIYEDTVKSLKSKTQTMALTQARDQLTYAAQNLMISYDQLLSQYPVVLKSVELAQSGRAAVKTQYDIGMATEADVLAAEKEVIAASESLENVENSLNTLKQNLCLLTGWSYDGNPVIGAIPEVTQEMIAAIDPEADKVKAIGNNYSLRSQRTSAASGSEDANKARDVKLRTMDETEQTVSSETDTLYQTLLSKKAAYDAAVTSYTSACTTKAGADRQYALGMLGKNQYLQMELLYLSSKASAESAGMSLYQAYEAYEWAVRGLIMTQRGQ